MTFKVQQKRSNTVNRRPDPATLLDGQLAVNYDASSASTGLFYKTDTGALIKVGPTAIGNSPPAPAAGQSYLGLGEQWLDTTGGQNVLKVWIGTSWLAVNGNVVTATQFVPPLTNQNLPAGAVWNNAGVLTINGTPGLGGVGGINISDLLGFDQTNSNFGAFQGTTLGENFNLKQLLQQLETAVEARALQSALPTSSSLHLDDLLVAVGIPLQATGLGTFTGNTIDNDSTVKGALQALETRLELVDIDTDDMAALVGLAENVNNLGQFSGTTIPDGESIKDALQHLETAVESKATLSGLAATLHLDDVRSALGIAEESVNFGAFSGTTLSDNQNLKQLLQSLETAVEGRSTLADANTFLGEHTLRNILHLDPGDGGLRAQFNRNVSNTQFDFLLGNVPSGARLNINTVASDATDALVVYSSKFWCRALGGGTGDAEFDGDVQVDGTLTVNSLDVGTQLPLKAAINNQTHTGTTKFEKVEVEHDGGFNLTLNRISNSQIDIRTGNIPSGGNLNLKNSNGTDAKVVVYSDLFWCRNLGGSSGNGTAKFDGDITAGSEIKMTNDYANKAAAGTGALGDIAVIGGALCFHDGTDWKTITLGSAPS